MGMALPSHAATVAPGNAMRTEGVLAVRKAEYHFAVVEAALPVIRHAMKIGCTTGEHLAEFLNAVGVSPYHEAQWTKNSANRAVQYLVKHGHLDWPRHRGKRNPHLELMRKTLFAKAVKACRKKEGFDTISKKQGMSH
jgi:hypothetical protein